ncbi:MAG: hypothetical protein WC806_05680 [Candidatus Gracilibacteria bacterium]|jgi:hypothetical protein
MFGSKKTAKPQETIKTVDTTRLDRNSMDQLKLQLKTLLDELFYEKESNGPLKEEEIIRRIEKSFFDSIPNGMENLKEDHSFCTDFRRALRDFLKIIPKNADGKINKEFLNQSIDEFLDNISATFLINTTKMAVPNRTLDANPISTHITKPEVSSPNKLMFLGNSMGAFIIFIATAWSSYLGAEHYSGQFLEWSEDALKMHGYLTPETKIALKTMLALGTSVGTSAIILKFKNQIREVMLKHKTKIIKSTLLTGRAILKRPVWALFLASLVYFDTMTNYTGFATFLTEKKDIMGQVVDAKAEVEAASKEVKLKVKETQDGLVLEIDNATDKILDEEREGNSEVETAGAGGMFHSKAKLLKDTPSAKKGLEKVIKEARKEKTRALYEKLREIIADSGLATGDASFSEEIKESITGILESHKGDFEEIEKRLKGMDHTMNIETINQILFEITGDKGLLQKLVEDINGQLKQSVESKMKSYNKTLEEMGVAAQSSGVYDKVDISKIPKLDIPKLDIKIPEIKIGSVKYKDVGELFELMEKEMNVALAYTIQSFSFILALIFSYLDLVFVRGMGSIPGLRKVWDIDEKEIAEKKEGYLEKMLDNISGLLQKLLNDPFGDIFATEKLNKKMIRKELEEFLFTGEGAMVTKEKKKRGFMSSIKEKTFRNFATTKMWENYFNTEIANEHNDKVRVFQAFLNSPEQITAFIKKLMPGFTDVTNFLERLKKANGKPESTPSRVLTRDQVGEMNDRKIQEKNAPHIADALLSTEQKITAFEGKLRSAKSFASSSLASLSEEDMTALYNQWRVELPNEFNELKRQYKESAYPATEVGGDQRIATIEHKLSEIDLTLRKKGLDFDTAIIERDLNKIQIDVNNSKLEPHIIIASLNKIAIRISNLERAYKDERFDSGTALQSVREILKNRRERLNIAKEMKILRPLVEGLQEISFDDDDNDTFELNYQKLVAVCQLYDRISTSQEIQTIEGTSKLDEIRDILETKITEMKIKEERKKYLIPLELRLKTIQEIPDGDIDSANKKLQNLNTLHHDISLLASSASLVYPQNIQLARNLQTRIEELLRNKRALQDLQRKEHEKSELTNKLKSYSNVYNGRMTEASVEIEDSLNYVLNFLNLLNISMQQPSAERILQIFNEKGQQFFIQAMKTVVEKTNKYLENSERDKYMLIFEHDWNIFRKYCELLAQNNGNELSLPRFNALFNNTSEAIIIDDIAEEETKA